MTAPIRAQAKDHEMVTPQISKLAQDFNTPGRDEWLALVEKALKGADFEKRLVSTTADGIRIDPLYTRADELPDAAGAKPGAAPFTRGLHATVTGGGWDIRQLHTDPDPKSTNTAILGDLNAGVSSITLQIAAPGQSGIPNGTQALKTALTDVRLDWAPIAFAPGTNYEALLTEFHTVVADGGFPKSEIDCALNADPFGELARNGSLPNSLDEHFNQLAQCMAFADQHYPKMRILLVDARVSHEAGATQGQELAALCATLVANLRNLESHNQSPIAVISRTAFAVSAESDIFLTIAKLRAARRLISRIADASGAGSVVENIHITASTSKRMLTKRDPWTNLLRTTTACAAAALGGADAITVLPFTWPLGAPDAFALRTARNIQMVCQEESSLGKVIDPAGGSWYIEKLTDDLANAAWDQFQQIESEGGLKAALNSGSLQERISSAADERNKRIATGKEPLTGTTTFPFLNDDGVTAEPHPAPQPVTAPQSFKPLKPRRLAEPYEQLRDQADAFKEKTGAWPQVFLASLGTIKDHTARSTWIKNLLAAGGINAITSDGFDAVSHAIKAYQQSGASVACICSSDDLYASHAVEILNALKAAGATHVYLAGRPRDLEDQLASAGLTGTLYAGQNALTELAALHEALKVSE